MIKYIGKMSKICEICCKYGGHIYLDDKSTVKGLFPEVDWKETHICEKCAKRESPKNEWKEIRRNG